MSDDLESASLWRFLLSRQCCCGERERKRREKKSGMKCEHEKEVQERQQRAK